MLPNQHETVPGVAGQARSSSLARRTEQNAPARSVHSPLSGTLDPPRRSRQRNPVSHRRGRRTRPGCAVGGSAARFRRFLVLLAPSIGGARRVRRARAVAVDLRGYGDSDKPPRGYDGWTSQATSWASFEHWDTRMPPSSDVPTAGSSAGRVQPCIHGWCARWCSSTHRTLFLFAARS